MVFGGIEKLTLIDYPGKVACVVYTIGCNFRCPFCHNPALVDGTIETKIEEKEVLAFLKRKKGFLDGVVITGGEPTLHGDDLLRFMAEVKGLGFLVKLDSNGTNPDILRTAIERHLVDYLAMDIKAPLSKYSATVARPVDMAAIRASIDLIMASPVPYEFRTTIVKSLLSPDDIEQIGRDINGARQYYLQKFISSGLLLNPKFKKKITYSDEEFEAFRNMLQRYVECCEIR
jgi:pyruvate formate lyase activating enzyme